MNPYRPTPGQGGNPNPPACRPFFFFALAAPWLLAVWVVLSSLGRQTSLGAACLTNSLSHGRQFIIHSSLG